MSWCAPEDLPTRCQAIWAEALDSVRRRRDPLEYTGTVASLMDLYIKHPSSSYRRLMPSSVPVYDSYIERLVRAYGARRIASMTGLDVWRWFNEIKGDGHVAVASTAIAY
jgi:hypothetical protein